MKVLHLEIRIMEISIFGTFIYLLIYKTSSITYGIATLIMAVVTLILQSKYTQMTQKREEEKNEKKEK